MTVVFVFKNGYELKVKCEYITLTTSNLTGRITGYQMDDIDSNKPLYIDIDEIICVYRVMADEEGSAK